MSDPLSITGVLLASYLLGSLPFGYVVTLIARKIDLRLVGSGHTGGTNVLRAAGALPAIITIIFDFAKGYLSVHLAQSWAPGMSWVAACAALAAVVGHVWSAFLGFKGGVGTMTTGGGAMALMPGGTVIGVVTSIIAIALKRMSSVGSLTFAALVPLITLTGALLGYYPYSYLIFAVGSSSIAVWSLRSNIRRIRDGSERRIGQQIPHGASDIQR